MLLNRCTKSKDKEGNGHFKEGEDCGINYCRCSRNN